MEELPVGTAIAGYRILRVAGRGATGVVYVGQHLHLGRVAAVKTLSQDVADDAEFRERFIRESRSAAAIDHPHIVPIYDAGEENGILYLVMRYVDGADVAQLLERQNGPLEPAMALDVVEQIAGALDAAHRRGLVHRDVKPANILIEQHTGPSPHTYLTDFGLTKAATASTLTRAGQFVGTLLYIAPEQIEGQAVSGASDQYSLACVLWETLVGLPPFLPKSGSSLSLLSAHTLEQVPLITSRRADLPAQLDEVFLIALAKSPEARYDDCRAFVRAARDALMTWAPEATIPTGLTRPGPPGSPGAPMGGPTPPPPAGGPLGPPVITPGGLLGPPVITPGGAPGPPPTPFRPATSDRFDTRRIGPGELAAASQLSPEDDTPTVTGSAADVGWAAALGTAAFAAAVDPTPTPPTGGPAAPGTAPPPPAEAPPTSATARIPIADLPFGATPPPPGVQAGATLAGASGTPTLPGAGGAPTLPGAGGAPTLPGATQPADAGTGATPPPGGGIAAPPWPGGGGPPPPTPLQVGKSRAWWWVVLVLVIAGGIVVAVVLLDDGAGSEVSLTDATPTPSGAESSEVEAATTTAVTEAATPNATDDATGAPTAPATVEPTAEPTTAATATTAPTEEPLATPTQEPVETPSAENLATQQLLEQGPFAFVSTRDGNPEIYLAEPDGSDPRRLTNDPAADGQPAWSPDASLIAFSSDRAGGGAIFVMAPDGSAVRQVSTGGGDSDPAWSPDGTQVVFSRATATGRELVVLTLADGSERILGVTTAFGGQGHALRPAWSPDGASIAYQIDGSGDYDIWVISPDGQGAHKILGVAGAGDFHPAWGPDGSGVLYTTDRDGTPDLWFGAPDGSQEAPLSINTDDRDERDGDFSTGGAHVVYVLDAGAGSQLVTGSIVTGEVAVVPGAPGDTDPSWRRPHP